MDRNKIKLLIGKTILGIYTVNILPIQTVYAEINSNLEIEDYNVISSISAEEVVLPTDSLDDISDATSTVDNSSNFEKITSNDSSHKIDVEDVNETTSTSNQNVEVEQDTISIESDIVNIPDNSNNLKVDIGIDDSSKTIEVTDSSRTIEDNWLNREVARQVFGDDNRYMDLTDDDYLKVEKIDLPNQGITGVIPSSLGKLLNLKELYIQNNRLTGKIPENIVNLTKLEVFNCRNNHLGGTIPEYVFDITSLTVLNLEYCGFSGTIPTKISNLVNLTELRLGGNSLTGTIPDGISNLKKLNTLFLGVNNLSGAFPECVLELPYLVFLSLRDNNFTGTLPSDLGKLTHLKELYIHGNEFSGSIPESITNMYRLSLLDCGDNSFSGALPEHIFDITSLTNLNFENCGFSGTIPAKISNLTNLTELRLSGNNLTGEIPKEIVNLTNLSILGLDCNNFTGSVPPGISRLSNLTQLYLNDNQLISLGENFPDKFKVDSSLAGNFIEGVSNQKEIVIKKPSKITVDVKSVLVLPKLTRSDIEVRWNGSVEELNSVYTLESILLDKSLFDSSLMATTAGVTEIKAKIVQADISNTSAQSSNSFDVEVIKKYIPISLEANLSTKNWTNGDVVITINATSSEDIDYIECPNGSKVYNNSSIDFVVSKNDTYTFEAVTVSGESKTIDVTVTNIDKTAPGLTLTQKESSNSTYTITATASDSDSGVKAIILPDGTYISKNTATYTATWDGEYEFTVIDNAGNTYTTSTIVSGIVLDDLWLAKEVAKQVGKDYTDLTQEDFDKITTINLANKGITGIIPSYIGNLTNVVTIKLNGNDLRGQIPSEIGNLSKLKTLWLTDNRLTGSIPSSIGNLSSLTNVDLALNFLEGEIPSSIGQLESLQYLYLCENKLTGHIPAELGNLTKLKDLCLDFNQFIGKIPTTVKNLKATKNFDYNFLEDVSSQNIMTVQENTVVSVSLNEEIDVEKFRYLIDINNGLRITTGVNKAYSLEFVPDDESFFEDGTAIKSGMTTGRIRMSGNEDSNENSMTENSITVNIQASQTDDINPKIEYSLSETNWTNKSISISVTATDNVRIKEIVLPDGSIVTDSNIEYIVDTNGVYTFKAIDVNGNESVINVPINNIDKDAPSLIVEYDRDTLSEQVTLTIKGIDSLSGVREIILPDKTIINGSEANYNIIENGMYDLSAFDNAGNITHIAVEINNIVDDNSTQDVIPPTDTPSEIIPPIHDSEEGVEVPIETPEGSEEDKGNNGDSNDNEESGDDTLDLENTPDVPVIGDSGINNKPINNEPDNIPSEVDKPESSVDSSDLNSEINQNEEKLDDIDDEISNSEDSEDITDTDISQYDDNNIDVNTDTIKRRENSVNHKPLGVIRVILTSTISIGVVAAYIQYLKKRRK